MIPMRSPKLSETPAPSNVAALEIVIAVVESMLVIVVSAGMPGPDTGIPTSRFEVVAPTSRLPMVGATWFGLACHELRWQLQTEPLHDLIEVVDANPDDFAALLSIDPDVLSELLS
jgi:hypothetical protein